VSAGVHQPDVLLLANPAHLVNLKRLEKVIDAMVILPRHRTVESVQTLAIVTRSLAHWARQHLADAVALLAAGSQEPVADLAWP